MNVTRKPNKETIVYCVVPNSFANAKVFLAVFRCFCSIQMNKNVFIIISNIARLGTFLACFLSFWMNVSLNVLLKKALIYT